MSLWNPDNIRDVGDTIGLSNLNSEVVENLARDIDFRMAQILEHAIKFMRHSKRTVLHTDDITQALKVLNIEPLFGYESTRPLRFGEAVIGAGNHIYWVDEDEVDFERLINAPLPKVPREITFTAHWLAIEGVQPSIPQNPTSAESRNQELLPKGPNANPNIAAMSGQDNINVRPLVKHILSSEIQLYFERITNAVMDERSVETRNAALNSVRTDPGLHQLVPYFLQFVADKVTHLANDLFVLTQMLQLSHAILQNKSLYVEPYIGALIPPVLTCLMGKSLGSPSDSLEAVTALRDLAASLIASIAKKHSRSSTSLQPRLARTLLRAFLDPNRNFGAHYGALKALNGIIGAEGVRQVILPNLKTYNAFLEEGLQDESKRLEAEQVLVLLLLLIQQCATDGAPHANGINGETSHDATTLLVEKVGSAVGERVAEVGTPGMKKVIMAVTPADTEE
jgi:transcription initiation factor TFIID subunit 6